MNPEAEHKPERTIFKLDKLVRDGIHKSMLELGQCVVTEHPSGQRPSIDELFGAKLAEELFEFKQPQPIEDRIKEAADFMAARDSYLRLRPNGQTPDSIIRYTDEMNIILDSMEISRRDVHSKQMEIARRLGEYDGVSYVYSLGVALDDSWHEYYYHQPDRSPILSSGRG